MENITSTSSNQNKLPISKFFAGIFIFIAIVIVCCIIGDHIAERNVIKHRDAGDWEVVSTQSYVRDGMKCMGYRVYVKRGYGTESIYKNIFSYLKSQDDYYQYTMWVYYDKSSARGTSSADYTIER